MQFEHAHGFRPQVRELLLAEWPEAYDEWMASGARSSPSRSPARRRSWSCAPAAARTSGPAGRGGRVRGSRCAPAASSAWSRSGAGSSASWSTAGPFRGPRRRRVRPGARLGGPVVEEIGGECGLAYVDRRYRLRQGAEPGPLTQPYVWGGSFDGFDAMVFPHERGHFSVVIVRPTSDTRSSSSVIGSSSSPPCCAVPGSTSGPTLTARCPAATCCPAACCATSTGGSARWPGWCRWVTPSPPRRRRPGGASPWPACRSGCCSG